MPEFATAAGYKLTAQPLPPEAVITIAGILGEDADAFIVGGQALNLWAEYYSSETDDLAEYRPYTSKDIDYFGQRSVAEKLANGLKGILLLPDADNTTFQTAIVEAQVNGITVQIDFLDHVLGVRHGIEDGVVDLVIPYQLQGSSGEINVRLMHPLHCLQSRVANITRLGRKDDTAMRQANATPIILRQFIDESLALGEIKAATDSFRRLFEFLRSDPEGRKAHKVLKNDPLEVLKAFLDDSRLDARYRSITLTQMIAKLESRRKPLGAIADALGIGGEPQEVDAQPDP